MISSLLSVLMLAVVALAYSPSSFKSPNLLMFDAPTTLSSSASTDVAFPLMCYEDGIDSHELHITSNHDIILCIDLQVETAFYYEPIELTERLVDLNITLYDGTESGHLQGKDADPSTQCSASIQLDSLVDYPRKLCYDLPEECPGVTHIRIDIDSAPEIQTCITITSVEFSATWLSRHLNAVLIILLLVTYTLAITQTLHRVVAGLGGILIACLIRTVTRGAPTISEIAAWIDPPTISLLFGLSIMQVVASDTGLVEVGAVRFLKFCKGSLGVVMIWSAVFTAIAAMFIDTISVSLIVVPVLIALGDVLSINHVPFLIITALASILGGMATPFGHMSNLAISSITHTSTGDFLANMAPPALLCSLAAIILVVRGIYHLDITQPMTEDGIRIRMRLTAPIVEALEKAFHIDQPKTAKVMKWLFIFVSAGVTIAPFFHISAGMIAMLGAMFTLLLTSRSVEDVEHHLERLDVSTILFFMIFSVFFNLLDDMGVQASIAEYLSSKIIGLTLVQAIAIIFVVVIPLCAISNNKPLVQRFVVIIASTADKANLPAGPLFWSLLISACVGTVGSLFGAFSTMATAGMSDWFHAREEKLHAHSHDIQTNDQQRRASLRAKGGAPDLSIVSELLAEKKAKLQRGRARGHSSSHQSMAPSSSQLPSGEGSSVATVSLRLQADLSVSGTEIVTVDVSSPEASSHGHSHGHGHGHHGLGHISHVPSPEHSSSHSDGGSLGHADVAVTLPPPGMSVEMHPARMGSPHVIERAVAASTEVDPQTGHTSEGSHSHSASVRVSTMPITTEPAMPDVGGMFHPQPVSSAFKLNKRQRRRAGRYVTITEFSRAGLPALAICALLTFGYTSLVYGAFGFQG